MLYGSAKNLLNSCMVLKPETASEQPVNTAIETQDEITFDDLLVAVGKTRNRDAFIRVFEHFAPRIKSFLMKGGMTQEMADELAQETMLTVWQKAARYDPQQAAASTWIFTIARNKKIDALRKAGRPQPDLNDPLMTTDIPRPDENLSKTEEAELLTNAIKSLPPEQAQLIEKSFFEDKTHQAIAEETDIPLGTVKSRIRLALQKLKHNMGVRQDESR